MNTFNRMVDVSISGVQAVLTGLAYLQALVFALLVLGVLAAVIL